MGAVMFIKKDYSGRSAPLSNNYGDGTLSTSALMVKASLLGGGGGGITV